jgi:hypothetical protein
MKPCGQNSPQQENIYSALGGPSFRDHFGVIEAAANAHIALSDAIESRAGLLDALMGEYGKRMAMAMAARRTFVGPCYQRPASSGFIN